MHPSQLSEEALLGQCTLRSDRRSGPGGQHRNKVETAVILKHQPTGVVAEANERRSQADNRRAALHRLRLALAVQVRQSPPEESSELWRSRVRGSRLSVSSEHHDFPALLAEALDCVAAAEFAMAEAAERLQVSSSQLVRLFRKYPPALALVNGKRQLLGLRKLS